MAEGLNNQFGFFREDILVPFVLVGAVVYVISELVFGRRKSDSKESVTQ
jgi:hypothetical protein